MTDDDGLDLPADSGAMPAADEPAIQPGAIDTTAWPEPNERHIQRLRADTSLADHFERKFGPGSASRALGIGATETAKAVGGMVDEQAGAWWGKRVLDDIDTALAGPRRFIRSTLGLPGDVSDPMAPIEAIVDQTARGVANMGELQKGAVRGIYGTKDTFGEGLEQYGKTIGSEWLAGLGDKISDEGKAVSRNALLRPTVDSFSKISKDKFVSDTADYLAGKLGEGVGNMASIAAIYAGGGVAGSAGFLATISIGEVRGELKEAGITDEGTLATYSYSAGMVVAALESLFPAHVLKELSAPAKEAITQHVMRTVAKASAGGAWREGLTEGLQEAVQIAATAHALDSASAFDTVPVIEAFRRGENTTRIIDAMIGGALPGGALGGQTAAAQIGVRNQDARREAKVRSSTPTATDASPEPQTAPPADTRPVAPSLNGPGQGLQPQEGAVRTQAAPEQTEALARVQSLLRPRAREDAERDQPQPGVVSRAAEEQPEPVREPTEAEIEADLPARAADIEQFYGDNDWGFDLDDADVRAVTRNMLRGDPVDVALETYFYERHTALARERDGVRQEQPQPVAGEPRPQDDGGRLREVGAERVRSDGAVPPAGDGQPGAVPGGAPVAEQITDQDRQAFARVLAGKVQRGKWGAAVGEGKVQALIDEAVADGRLEMRNGQPRRTAKAKTIPEALRNLPAAPAAEPARPKPSDDFLLVGLPKAELDRARVDMIADRPTQWLAADAQVSLNVEMDDNPGERVSITMPAREALDMTDRRLKGLAMLARCIGG